jgi:hypothetical protein
MHTGIAFSPFEGRFSPNRAKIYLQKKESTMLPQAKTAFCVSQLQYARLIPDIFKVTSQLSTIIIRVVK